MIRVNPDKVGMALARECDAWAERQKRALERVAYPLLDSDPDILKVSSLLNTGYDGIKAFWPEHAISTSTQITSAMFIVKIATEAFKAEYAREVQESNQRLTLAYDEVRDTLEGKIEDEARFYPGGDEGRDVQRTISDFLDHEAQIRFQGEEGVEGNETVVSFCRFFIKNLGILEPEDDPVEQRTRQGFERLLGDMRTLFHWAYQDVLPIVYAARPTQVFYSPSRAEYPPQVRTWSQCALPTPSGWQVADYARQDNILANGARMEYAVRSYTCRVGADNWGPRYFTFVRPKAEEGEEAQPTISAPVLDLECALEETHIQCASRMRYPLGYWFEGDRTPSQMIEQRDRAPEEPHEADGAEPPFDPSWEGGGGGYHGQAGLPTQLE